jgi:tetratricopeptide (TPR) repeat protein
MLEFDGSSDPFYDREFPMSFLSVKRRFLLLFLSHALLISCVSLVIAQDQPAVDDPVAIFNQGQDAHEKGDLPAAVELYRRALKLFPEFPEAEYQLGNAYLALGKTDDAEKSFSRAIELRADWSLPMVSLGAVLVDKNRFPEAEKILLRAIELDAQNPPAYVALTDLRLKTGAPPAELKELLTKLRLLTGKVKAGAAVWSARAAVERTLGDLAAAKTSLGRALAIEPLNKSALAERTTLALAENDAAGALENAKTLAKIAPRSPNAQFLLARAHAAAGSPVEALKILNEIENISPEMKAFRDKITANTTVSAADLEKQLENDPRNAPVLGRLCAVLRAEDPLKALNYCRRAAEADPNELDYAIGYGAALVQARQYETAAALFRRIIAVAPENYTAHANLAVALFQLKRYPEAKTEYLWLAEKQPELAVTYYFLGIIFDSLTEYMDAMANYQQFLRLADAERNKLEIEKVNLRLPGLQKQIKEKKGKKNE